ncbi:5'-nucleotidase [Microbacterium halimionae]|uniref:5'-nucleotidase n=1 Tax=Microbacterium halimionae TaxID=1526413 RepID=A0A7W3PKS1_9MICO|nr:ExeM/NucH family extracellular endonuclease [Microbacterium halimionae]MBA8815413.1 5'-nucleotidase [Microbacterium halimionae]NII95460.1 5'-nucleotidase [Microbacterium halimionae]
MFSSQQSRSRSVLAVGIGAALAGGMLFPLPAIAADGSDVIINEAYVNGSGGAAYKSRFIELYNAGDVAQSLDGWSLQYKSATGTNASVQSLSGTIAANDYFLIALPGSAGGLAELPVSPDFTGVSITPSGSNGVLWLADVTTPIALSPGSVTDSADVIDLIGYGTGNVYETAAASSPAGTTSSLARTDFVDTDNNSTDFSVAAEATPQSSSGSSEPTPEPTETATPEPTATASPEPTDPTEPTVTSISEIQGTGAASPIAGQTVTTRGVVTAAYPTGGFNGFYIQTPGTGGALDMATHAASEAVFVYGSQATAKVSVGDYVEVTGPVSEYNGTTEISPSAANVTVLDEETPAVSAVDVAWPESEEARETLEGMLVAPQGDFTVSDTYSTNYYASIGLASGATPLMTPTEVAKPGSAEYDAAVADNAARAVTLDDGASINFNSSANKSIPLPYLSTTDPVRVGAAVSFTAPVIVEYRNSGWNFQPTQHLTADNASTVQPATFENTRTASPADVGGDIQIASFNVLNYFTTTGEDAVGLGASCSYYTDRAGNKITVNNCSGTAAVRGAADDANLARQQAKIVAAINGLDAEVVSLEEIENSTIAGVDRDSAVAELVGALNDAAESDVWDYARTPDEVPAGEDVIRTAFIYKKAAVEPVGDAVIDDDSAFSNARYPLAQAFMPAGGSEDDTFLAIVNHFKSKGSGEGENADQGDGQGASNAARVAQAEALVDFSAELQLEVGTDDVFLIGDFNSYTQEDPMQVFYEAGYVDQGSKTDKYTYSFSGQSGSLDHILASSAADDMVTGVDIWNINSVESIALEYSRYNYNATIFYDESPYRSSDHDPVVVGLDLDAADATVELNLLNINDFHGRIDANTVKFAGTIEQLRAEYGDENTLFLSAGDNIGASLFASSSADDQPTLDVLNALGLAASAVGNHEFDKGVGDLTGRVSEEADFPYLAANVYDASGEPIVDEYALFEVDGLTVAVIGAITEETPTLVSPGGISGLTFGDPVEAVNRVAAELEGTADVIIAEYHEGSTDGVAEDAAIEEEIAAGGAFADIVTKTSASVDAIFTGHTHKEYSWDGPIPGAEGTRPVVQTGSYGENIGQVVLEVDPVTGDVEGYEAKNVARVAIADDGNEDNDAEQSAALDAELVSTYPRVAEVSSIVSDAIADAAVIGEQVKGSVVADITTAFTGGSYVDGVWTGVKRDDRASQSTLGNLVADSLVSSLSSADRGGAEIGMVNPGGLRSDLLYGEDGTITYAEANAVLPFVNNLWTTTLTGAQFTAALEQQWQPEGASRSYLALGLSDNVRYTYDKSAPRGEHITGVWIDGEPIDPAGEYRVGSFSFLLQGGDNFTVLAEGSDTKDSGLIDRDAWISYLEANPGLEPDFASRSAEVTGVPETVEVGDTVSLQVSGINLTSLGSPENTVVEASIDDTVFAPFTVTGGVATVEFTVPDSAVGESVLSLVATDSGTQVTVPLTVTEATVPTEPTEPGTGLPGTGGSEQPTTMPTPATDAELTAALSGKISIESGELVPGGMVTVNVGTQYSGEWVTVWLHSTPQQLMDINGNGWLQVSTAGTVTVQLPAGVTGDHRLVVLDADGNVIGWQAITIESKSALAATGGDFSRTGGLLLAIMLLLGLGLTARVVATRRA